MEEFAADLTTWLLGQPIPLTQLSPSELSLEPIRADSLILQESENLVLHVEFQTAPDPKMPFRMADYYLRVYRRFPEKTMRQIVVYLRETTSELVYQETFEAGQMRHGFEAIRLWEQPLEQFLSAPGLLPFAPLSQTQNRVEALRLAAREIEKMRDRRRQSNVASSAAVLAGLVLTQEEIRRLLRSEVMKESVIYQEIKEEGLREGRQEGLQQGLQQGRQSAIAEIAAKLLDSGMEIEQVASVTGLTVTQVQDLENRE